MGEVGSFTFGLCHQSRECEPKGIALVTESPSAYVLVLPGPADVQSWLWIQVPRVRAEKVV